MSKVAKLVLPLILLAVIQSFGQKKLKDGFIVTTQNDTLRGKVALFNDSLLLFEDSNSVKQQFTANNISAAFRNGKYYASEKVVGNNRFIQEIVIGYMSLYRSVFSNPNEKYFIKKDSSVFVLTPTNLLNFITLFSNECQQENSPSEKQNKQQYRYSLKSLTGFVDYYNSCKGRKDEQVIKHTPEKFIFKPLVYGTLDVYQFNLGNKNKDNSEATLGKNVGFAAGASFRLFGNDTGFSFHPGFLFLHRKGEANLYVPINKYTSVDAKVSVSFIDFPLLFRYKFAGEKYRPYLSFGPHAGRAYMSKIERTPHRFEYPDNYGEPESHAKLIAGISGGAGILFPRILKGMEVEIRAVKSYYDNKIDIIGLQSSSLQLSVGLYLK